MIDVNPPGNNSFGNGINASGQVVGYTGGGAFGFVYSNGKTTKIDAFGFLPSAINASGQVVGVDYQAALYSGGKITHLGSLAGSFGYSVPRAINDSGQVVGIADLHPWGSNGGMGAFLYSGGKMINLGTLGGSQSEARALNASGQVVGNSTTANGQTHPFLFSNGKMSDLGTLGGQYGSAEGINNAGQIVGSAQTSINGPGHAFVFIDGKMTDLNNLIPPESHWFLTNASAINNLGQIVGMGRNPNGDYHAFLLTPEPAPEPASLTLLALGALGLAGHAWRKRRRAGA
jgi:probable HAF family extracellular repeat protein